ncbi:MAG: TetR/AcrR family transcriptional regulator [Spirochaetaceae bacterium]|nr:TetR/AcrR family transcriptional regulator [Spirochaetaceae bacterium]
MAKNEPKQIRINQIIEAAIQEFVEKGYHGASLRSIANRAGLSKGGIYHHFSSKDEILIEASNKYMEPVFQFMEDAQNNKSSVKGLTDFIIIYLTYCTNHPRTMVFTFLSLAKILDTEEMWPGMNEYAKHMISFYEDLLNKGIESGELKEHDSRVRARMLFSSIDGIVGYMIMCESIDKEETMDQFIKFYIKDIER